MTIFQNAFVKPPSASYANALTHDTEPSPVDLALARQQHFAYVTALRKLDVQVTELAPDDDFPDSCFVQDVALAIDGQLIVTRPGAESRRGEPDAMMEALRSTGLMIQRIVAPAIMDGGDVLLTEDTAYVGLSARTNAEAVTQLQGILRRKVIGVPLPAGLHLLSSCAYLGGGRLLTTLECAGCPELQGFEHFIIAPEEAYAANVLVLGQHALMPAGHPLTDSILREAGIQPHPLDMSEFEKRDGGVTCLSLLW